MLQDKIRNKKGGILLYGITPPKSNNPEEKIIEITNRHIARISSLDIDGLIVYDIQDESARTKEARTFEFIRTVDPAIYSYSYLKSLDVPKIVYRCVGSYSEEEFTDWLEADPDGLTVFVGVASVAQSVKLKLPDAYDLRTRVAPDKLLGAVMIPERHKVHGDEPARVLAKIESGCSFFVSQAVYDFEASKQFLIDYKAACVEKGIEIAPIIFTLTPCGSEKTLQFIKWLGISVPAYLEDILKHSGSMLAESLEVCENIFKSLYAFAREEGIPIGANVESVSIRKEEIEASIQLAKDLRSFLDAQ